MDLWRNLKSPIEEEAARQFEVIRPSISSFSCRDLCQTCGRKENVGIYECMTGGFKCVDCIKRQIITSLEEDVDWQRREKIFNMRRAREKHQIDSEASSIEASSIEASSIEASSIEASSIEASSIGAAIKREQEV